MKRASRDGKQQEHARWLKRQAVQIVAQLPEDEVDATKILEYARDLVTRFIGNEPERGSLSTIRLIAGKDAEVD